MDSWSEEQQPLLGVMAPTTHPQPVKTYDLGTIDADGYGKVLGFSQQQSYEEVPGTTNNNVPPARRKRVIIVGAGISGIQQASTLLRGGQVRHEDMVIFDTQDHYGGVWEKNKYPGCACDVPAMLYTTSYFVNKEYTHFFATREEIQDYYIRFAQTYCLETCTHFQSFVKACSWNDETLEWNVSVVKKGTGEIQHWIADVVIQCVGSLDRPKFGNLPDRDKFKGVSWHTAHWRDDYDLHGKRVGIIGCGPSVAQIIPEIIDKVDHLTIYMRTPPVCLPRGDFAFSRTYRWALKWVPFFAFFQRLIINLWVIRFGQKLATDGDDMNDDMNQKAVEYMESQIKDPKLREIVRPNAKYYCKRPLALDTFYSTLAKPNCTVVRDKLLRYTAAGVLSLDNATKKEMERSFDVIIFGTGFNVANYLEHEIIHGINGVSLQDKWKEHPEALYGLGTNQFPNMFMCFGPNSATVWSSQQDNWEQQARFNAKMVHEIMRRERNGRKLAVHPTRAAEAIYNNEVQRRQMGRFVWARADCVTYYKNDAGWITYTMPWSWWEFRKMLRKVNWTEWITLERPIDEPRPSWAPELKSV